MIVTFANMQIEMLPVEGLKEYEKNARTHSEAEILETVELIREFGWTNPVQYDERGIVAGHRRKMAATRIYAGGETIKWPDGTELPFGCVPCINVTGWTDAQRRAAILADNKTTLNGGWDLDVLSEELRLIGEADFDLSKTGFSTAEIDALLKDVEPFLLIPENPVAKKEDKPESTPAHEVPELPENEPKYKEEAAETLRLTLEYPTETYWLVKEALAKHGDTLEEALLNLLNL